MQRYFSALSRLIKPRQTARDGQKLYAACVDQARRPVFYLDYGVEDAIGARFELLTFHVALVIERLKALPAGDPRREEAQELAQSLFDTFVSALDNTLREQGTGDLSVPKKMKALGQVIYARMKRWDELWPADDQARSDYVARTILAGDDGDDAAGEGGAPGDPARAAALAAYAAGARAGLDVAGLLRGEASWPEPAAREGAEHG